jgi:4-hydroxybenzoate polyprenyltransferase
MNKHVITLLRPQQWLKNFFVFTPLFFDRRIADWHYAWPCIVAFLVFCLTASGIYCLNDIRDAKADSRHPVKRWRPVASGQVSKGAAYVMMAVAWATAFALVAIFALYPLASTLLIYIAMNIAYCLKLKQMALLDVLIIAMGFVMRIVAGSQASGIALSPWIVITTFLLALFLALAKRRDDVLRMNETGEAPRKNTIRYNLTFINEAITITAGVTLVCYIMYTVSPEVVQNFHTDYLYLTSIFVLVGLLRYIQIAVVDKKSGDPTKVILRDTFTQLIVLAWGLAFLVIIYFM